MMVVQAVTIMSMEKATNAIINISRVKLAIKGDAQQIQKYYRSSVTAHPDIADGN